MRPSPGSEFIRECQEVRLVDGVEDLNHRRLDEFVFQGGDAAPQASIWIGYENPARRLGPVVPGVNLTAQPLEVGRQIHTVLSPRNPINLKRDFRLQTVERTVQTILIEMMQSFLKHRLLVLRLLQKLG